MLSNQPNSEETAGDEYRTTWRTRRIISIAWTVLLSGFMVVQIIAYGRAPAPMAALIVLFIASYWYNTHRITELMKQPEISAQIDKSSSRAEIEKLFKGTTQQKITMVLIYLALGALYFLYK